MNYSKMTKEQLIAEIQVREGEVKEARQRRDDMKWLTDVEVNSLRWTWCPNCNNRIYEDAGCRECNPAKAELRKNLNRSSNGKAEEEVDQGGD